MTWGLSKLTGWIPFSIGESALVVWIATRLFHGVRAVTQIRRGRPVTNVLASGGLVVLQDVGVVIAAFYLTWGFHYCRPPLEDRLGWSAVGTEASADELAALAERFVVATNDAYVAIHGTTDAEEPTQDPDPSATEREVEVGWQRAAESLPLGAIATARYGRSKRAIFSPLLNRLGISGFYLPMTGEAHINRGVPACSYPQVVAHEKAHQRGVAPENEANFVGYLAGASSPSPRARYAAYLFAQRQLLIALLTVDEERAGELIERRHPGVQRDVNDLRAYWSQFRGTARNVSRAVNDAYLRTNRVEGGVASYGKSVELLIAMARSGAFDQFESDWLPRARK